MTRFFYLLLVVVFLASCGKNDSTAFSGNGFNQFPNQQFPNQFPNQYPNNNFAPYPPYGGYPTSTYSPYGGYYPNGGYPQIGYPYGGQYPGSLFQPGGFGGGFGGGFPSGYSNQYTPWLPLHQWMQQNPYRSQYYQSLMNNWYNYAQYQGYSPYYFPGFWLDYTRNLWNGTQYQPIFDYFAMNVYPWVNWNTQFPSTYPAGYWDGYNGFPYSFLDSLYPGNYYWY